MGKIYRLFKTYTPVYYWNKDSDKRFVVNQGGTSSSKTVSILQHLAHVAVSEPGVVITVVARTATSLERGAIRDFKTLLDSSLLLRFLLKDPSLKKGPYMFKNGSVIEFANLNDPESAKHGKRDYLFLNECNSIDYESAKQLIVRTSKRIFIDYNPDSKFWVHDEIIGNKDCDLFISNFTHNPFCGEQKVKEIRKYKEKFVDSGDPVKFKKWKISGTEKDYDIFVKTTDSYWRNKWYVYGLGLTGIVEGVIFERVNWITMLPPRLIKKAYALDFGFTTDPTALSLIGMRRGEIYAKELLYETGLTTPDIMAKFRFFGITKNDLIIADSANQDAIVQMQRKGYNIVPADKPPGSVKTGLDGLRAFPMNITKDSKNWKKEQERYKWKKVRGEWTNEPEDKDNHLWDGMRYWWRYMFINSKKPRKRKKHKRKVREVSRT